MIEPFSLSVCVYVLWNGGRIRLGYKLRIAYRGALI
jgi:hypothetical protein